MLKGDSKVTQGQQVTLLPINLANTKAHLTTAVNSRLAGKGKTAFSPPTLNLQHIQPPTAIKDEVHH